MFRHARSHLALAALLALFPMAIGAQSKPNLDEVITRIKDEGTNRSQVMQTLSYLTDVIGPRLTASPQMKRANEWTRDKMTEWGLQNAHLEAWGPFGRSWSLERFSAQVVSPQTIPLIAYPKAWSPGLRGTYTGEVVYLEATDEAGLAKYKGKLKGAIVLTSPPRAVKAWFTPMGTRYTDDQLKKMDTRQAGSPSGYLDEEEMQPGRGGGAQRLKFLMDEGVAATIDPSFRGDGGTLFVQSAAAPPPPDSREARRVPIWDKNAPKTLPQITMSIEHYNRLVRMLQQGEKLRMAVELKVRFHEKDLMGYNTVAEIPGSDLKDQVVMLGGHMDSWHSGTGATDNAAGCAVMMEAVRILKALGLQPRRTIRVALWSGEEQGLFGSRAYVTEHFAARGSSGSSDARKPEYEKLSVYFNLDNGTGKIRGVYMQNNKAAEPLFREWLKPFAEMGADTLTLRGTGGTDHLSFDGVGLPGFQFIQDEIEYDTRTHHSNQDLYDRIQADDMKQAATIVATFAYQAAMMEERFPRKSR